MQELTSHLVSLGLGTREAKLYVSLLQVDEAVASKLQRVSGVPRTKIYEALERLASLGFCIERIENRKRFYHAVPPEEVHQMLIRKWETEAQDRAGLAKKVFSELDSCVHKNGDNSIKIDSIEVLRNRAQINRKYVSLVNETRSEILCFIRPPFSGSDPENGKEQDIAEAASIQRKVKHRSVYMNFPGLKDLMLHNTANWSYGLDEDRVIEELPIKMFVFDLQKTLLAVPSIPGTTGEEFSMIVIDDPSVARTFSMLFEVYWKKAIASAEWLKAKH